MVEALFNVLSRYHPLSEDFKLALECELVPLSLPKNRVLLDVPKVASHAYFLADGFAMSYSFHEGRKITQSFWKPGDIIVAIESFFERSPSMECIQLMHHSQLLCVSYESVMSLLERFHEARQICQRYIIHHYAESRVRVRELQQLSAHERFQNLLTSYPGLELIASQDAIASYIGITAQSLARMKHRRS
jgi:CRP-like cAMP-binding protein